MNYKYTSSVYDIMDVMLFRNIEQSPRTALLDAIPDEPVRVLDLCAGTCTNSILVAENKPKAKITAVDLSADMLRVASEKVQNKGIQNIEMVVADATRTGYDNDSFDIIILSLVLHEMDGSLQRAIIIEAKRLLSDNGKMIVIEWFQPEKISKRFMFALLVKPFEPKGFKEFLKKNMVTYFEGFGFTVIDENNCDYTKVYHLKQKQG